MEIALIGYGKMGRLIERIALEEGHQVVACFSPSLGTLKERRSELERAAVVLDFSHPSAVLEHLSLCLESNKPLLIGTTGWEEGVMQARRWVEAAGGSCLYAPNFSVGVCLFEQIVAYAASLCERFQEYDVGGVERHHRQKEDAPSGTAKALSQTVLNAMPRLARCDFSSIRCGYAPGTHTLYFDSPTDTLTLTHQAHNREGFARGALMAAEWLLPLRGFFTLQEMMQDRLSRGTR